MKRKASKSKSAPSPDIAQSTSSTTYADHPQNIIERTQAYRQDLFDWELFNREWFAENYVEPSQEDFAAFDDVLTDQPVNSTVTEPASESQFQAALPIAHAPTAMMQNQPFPEASNPVQQNLQALAEPNIYPQASDDYAYTTFSPSQTQLQSMYPAYQEHSLPQPSMTGAHPQRSIESQMFIAAQQGLQLPFNTQLPFDAPVLFDGQFPFNAQVPLNAQASIDPQAPSGPELQFHPQLAFNPEPTYDPELSFGPEVPSIPVQGFPRQMPSPHSGTVTAYDSSPSDNLSTPSPMSSLPSNLMRPRQRGEPMRRFTPSASAHSKKASRVKPNRRKRYPRHDRKGDDYQVEAYDQLTATEILNGGKGSITIRSHEIDGPAIMKVALEFSNEQIFAYVNRLMVQEGFEPKERANGLNLITKRVSNSLKEWTKQKAFASAAEANEFEAAWRELRLRTMATTGITGNALNPRNPKKMSANARARQSKPRTGLAPAQ